MRTYVIHGIQTNIPFLVAVVQNEAFISEQYQHSLLRHRAESLIYVGSKKQQDEADQALVGAAFLLFSSQNQALEGIEPDHIWQQIGYWRLQMEIPVRVEQQDFMFAVDEISHSRLRLQSKGRDFDLKLLSWDGLQMRFSNADTIYTIAISPTAEGTWLLQYDGLLFQCERTDELNEQLDHGQHAAADEEGGLFAPMPGKVIQLNVKEGQSVNRGAVLLVVEAMKMENNIVAPFDAIVDKINVKTDEMVDAKTQLIHLSPQEKD